MKYRIKIFADFASSIELKKNYESICEVDKMDNYGVDKDIYITEHDDYTHAIIINFIMPELKDIPKKNVVGLAHEPTIFFIHSINTSYTPSIFFYAIKHIGKYFMGDRVFVEPFIEHFSYMQYNKPLRYIPIKNKLMSFIISEKNDQWFGYSYRHIMVELILKNNLPIASFYITETNDDVRIMLPNYLSGEEYMVDGINVYVRTANGKSCRVYGSSNTNLTRMYDIGSGNAAAKDYVVFQQIKTGISFIMRLVGILTTE
jgi:hypothetical protein